MQPIDISSVLRARIVGFVVSTPRVEQVLRREGMLRQSADVRVRSPRGWQRLVMSSARNVRNNGRNACLTIS